MFKTLATVLLASATQAALGDTADILLIGDSFFGYTGYDAKTTSIWHSTNNPNSWMDNMPNLVEKYCLGKKVVNRALSSTTADDWANGVQDAALTQTDHCYLDATRNGKGIAGSCLVEGALDPKIATGYKTIWLSVGANDYQGAYCNIPHEQLQKNVKGAIDRIIGVASGDIRILMTGYPVVTGIPFGNSDCTLHNLSGMNLAIQRACESEPRCDFISIQGMTGGNINMWASKPEMFTDEVHLNEYGYCTLVNMTPIQLALGCDMIKRLSTPYDCEDQYAWIWVVASIGGAGAIALLVWIVTEFMAMGDEQAAIEDKRTEAEKEYEEKNLNEVDNMNADFSDYHSINSMKTALPSSFEQHLQTAVEYLQSKNFIPFAANPPAVGQF